MTLIQRRTDDWISTGADASLTGICLGTCVSVVAGSAVGDWKILTLSRARIADSLLMTLIRRCAYDRVRARAYPFLTGVSLGAGILIVARGSIGFYRI